MLNFILFTVILLVIIASGLWIGCFLDRKYHEENTLGLVITVLRIFGQIIVIAIYCMVWDYFFD